MLKFIKTIYKSNTNHFSDDCPTCTKYWLVGSRTKHKKRGQIFSKSLIKINKFLRFCSISTSSKWHQIGISVEKWFMTVLHVVLSCYEVSNSLCTFKKHFTGILSGEPHSSSQNDSKYTGNWHKVEISRSDRSRNSGAIILQCSHLV